VKSLEKVIANELRQIMILLILIVLDAASSYFQSMASHWRAEESLVVNINKAALSFTKRL